MGRFHCQSDSLHGHHSEHHFRVGDVVFATLAIVSFYLTKERPDQPVIFSIFGGGLCSATGSLSCFPKAPGQEMVPPPTLSPVSECPSLAFLFPTFPSISKVAKSLASPSEDSGIWVGHDAVQGG